MRRFLLGTVGLLALGIRVPASRRATLAKGTSCGCYIAPMFCGRGLDPRGTCPMGQYSTRAAALKSGDEPQYCPHPRNDRLARRRVGWLPLDAVRLRAADDPQGH